MSLIDLSQFTPFLEGPTLTINPRCWDPNHFLQPGIQHPSITILPAGVLNCTPEGCLCVFSTNNDESAFQPFNANILGLRFLQPRVLRINCQSVSVASAGVGPVCVTKSTTRRLLLPWPSQLQLTNRQIGSDLQ